MRWDGRARLLSVSFFNWNINRPCCHKEWACPSVQLSEPLHFVVPTTKRLHFMPWSKRHNWLGVENQLSSLHGTVITLFTMKILLMGNDKCIYLFFLISLKSMHHRAVCSWWVQCIWYQPLYCFCTVCTFISTSVVLYVYGRTAVRLRWGVFVVFFVQPVNTRMMR